MINCAPNSPRTVERRCRLLTVGSGWTLIELIGALAVGAVVLVLVVPALLRELDRLAVRVEVQRLRNLGQALRDQIQKSGKIPDALGLAEFVAPALGVRAADLATNSRGVPRAVVWDPRQQIGPATNRALPFVQTWTGSAAPVLPRLVVISSLGEPLPAGLTNGATLTVSAFEALWQTMPETIPVGWVWSGRREDLLIERWDLADLFVAVTLNNRAATNAGWSVPPNSTGALGQGTVTTCFLRGTPVQLFGENGQAQTTEVVLAPQSWLYYGGKWQRTGAWNLPPSVPSGSDFAELADAFRRAPINPGSPAETPDHALAAMTNYAVAYQAWAAAGFGSPLQQDAALMQAWRALRQATSELLQAP